MPFPSGPFGIVGEGKRMGRTEHSIQNAHFTAGESHGRKILPPPRQDGEKILEKIDFSVWAVWEGRGEGSSGEDPSWRSLRTHLQDEADRFGHLLERQRGFGMGRIDLVRQERQMEEPGAMGKARHGGAVEQAVKEVITDVGAGRVGQLGGDAVPAKNLDQPGRRKGSAVGVRAAGNERPLSRLLAGVVGDAEVVEVDALLLDADRVRPRVLSEGQDQRRSHLLNSFPDLLDTHLRDDRQDEPLHLDARWRRLSDDPTDLQ